MPEVAYGLCGTSPAAKESCDESIFEKMDRILRLQREINQNLTAIHFRLRGGSNVVSDNCVSPAKVSPIRIGQKLTCAIEDAEVIHKMSEVILSDL